MREARCWARSRCSTRPAALGPPPRWRWWNRTRVVWLEHDALFAWLDRYPRVAVDMLQVLANRMRSNNERITDLVFMDVPARLAKTLLDLASRFGEPVEAGLKVRTI